MAPINIIGEAGIRVGALTAGLERTIRRSINDALRNIKAPRQNALTELQRELNRGELNLADATRKHSTAVADAERAERALVAVRRDASATDTQLADAEERHRVSLLRVTVALDDVHRAEERVSSLHQRLARATRDLGRNNDLAARSFGTLTRSLGSLASGLGKTLGLTAKIGLIGVVAGGAVAGVSSLTVGVGALAAALAQAAGAAGLLPAVIAGKWAVIGTAKLALTGMADAMKAVVSGDAAKLDEALKDMAPSAQTFVREIAKVKPAFDRMRLDVQQRAFAGLGAAVGDLSSRYLPVANRLFTGLAGTMNGMARDVIAFAFSSRALSATNSTVTNLRTSFASLRPAIAPAAEALLNVVSVGSTFLPRLTAQFSSGLQGISRRITEMAQNGELEAFFQRALDTVRQLGRIAGNVGGALAGIFRAAKGAGAGFLDNLERITAQVRDFINSAAGQSAIGSFFASMRVIMQALMPVIQQLALIFGQVLAPIIANIASTVLPALLPLLQALGRLLQAAAPLIDVMAEAFASLLVALAPVLDMFAQALTDVMPQLIPAIMAIGEALVQLITAAAPLLPLFAQLLAALLPILPPIIQLAAALIPPLIAIIQALMPVIQALVAAFVAVMPVVVTLAQVISAVLLPPIRLIAVVVTAVVNVAVAIFNALKAGVSAAIRGVVNAVGWIGALPGRVARWFGSLKDGAINRARALLAWLGGLPGRILSALGNLGSLLLQAGKNIIMGLLNGLKSAAGAVLDWIGNLLSSMGDAVLDFFGIGSPSKLMHRYGEFIGQGLARGIRASTPTVLDAANRLASGVADAVRVAPPVDVSVSAGLARALATQPPAGGDGASSPTDPDAIADGVARGLGEMQVVISESEITSRVNRRNRLDRRR